MEPRYNLNKQRDLAYGKNSFECEWKREDYLTNSDEKIGQ